MNKQVNDLEKLLRFFRGTIAWMIEAAAILSLLMGHWADLTNYNFATQPCTVSPHQSLVTGISSVCP